MRRTIQRLVENPISSGILRREFQENDTVIVDAHSNGKLIPRLLVPGATPVTRTDEVLTA